MKVDPFAPQLLIDYDLYCREFGRVDFGAFMSLWHVVTAFIEAAEDQGLSLEEMVTLAEVVFPESLPN